MKALLSTIFLVTCQLYALTQATSIPDPNFEQALIDLGYDAGPVDGTVPTVNIKTVTQLNVDNKSISSMTGLEDFSALTHLYCSNNNLQVLDLSENMNLKVLSCHSNQLTNIDLTNVLGLTCISCRNNLLYTVNITHSNALTYL